MLLGQTILHPLCSKSIPFISNKPVLPLMQQNHSKIHWSLYASFCCCGPCSSLFELPRNKKLEQILPNKDGMSPEKKAFGWEMWEISSNPTKPPIFRGHASFQGAIFFGLGLGNPSKPTENRAGHSHCNGGGGGMPMAASGPGCVGGWFEGVGCYASKIIHPRNLTWNLKRSP